MTEQYLATKGSFIGGSYHPRGSLVDVDPRKVKDGQKNLVPAGDIGPLDVVEMSAIGPTGPNPKAPQQVPPDAVQTIAGHEVAGARLVGEVTRPQEERLAEITEPSKAKGTQELVSDKIAGIENKPTAKAEADALLDDNDDDDLVAGNSAAVIDSIGPDTDLDRLEAAEKDREVPRKGVLAAIEKVRKERTEA
jgi:hypothetical protein